MKTDEPMSITEADPEKWGVLYRITGILTVAMLVIIPVQIIIFVLFPQPQTPEAWLELFGDNPLIGLAHLDGLYLVNNTIVAVIYLAFFVSLYKRNAGLIALAILLGLLGIASYYASNKSVEMLFLSQEYFLGSGEMDKSVYLSSAQNMLLEWEGTAYVVYYLLNGIALVLISISMFNSAVYQKNIAVLGMISAFFMLIPANFGTIGMVFALTSLVPWYVFSIQIARVFFRLGRPLREKH